MKAKIISLVTISLCISSFNVMAQSDEYYSSQSPNGGYYTSSTPKRHDTYHVKRHADNGRQKALQWRTMVPGSPIPPNAIVGGNENGQELYICHARYNGGMHPGKVVGENCDFGWGGNEIVTSQFEILSSNAEYDWVPAENGYIPRGAVIGGFENNGNPVFICQARFHGGMHPGKIVGQSCNISWGGKEVSKLRYNVLVM